MTTQLQFNLKPERRIWTVSELTARIRDLLARNFTDMWVTGEISNARVAQSGHLYFTLKDERARIRCVCFKQQLRLLKFDIGDGLRVNLRGSVSVYEPSGEYQIYVETIEPAGLGALQLAFEQLKKRLEAEGLFDPARKKPLPLLPRRIGLVTSPGGAAVRDVVRILVRRFPNVYVTVLPVRVQGPGAAQDIAEALEFFNRRKIADVLILARGGGSIEDLWAFNEEIVARAIAASAIPVISGVGHETDFTIADFVADVRASTPSAAAEIVVQTRREFDKHVADLRDSLTALVRYRLLEWSRRVHELSARSGFRRPLDLLRQRRQRADELTSRLALGLRARLNSARKRFNLAHVRLARFDLRARVVVLHRRVAGLQSRLALDLQGRLDRSRKRLSAAQVRLMSFDFRAAIGRLHIRLQRVSNDLSARAERFLRRKRDLAERLRLQLEERSPLRVLERGYAIAYDAAGNVLRSTEQVALGDAVAVQLHRGRLTTEVKRKD
ncbi:MAG TPA: exodeoxyribonuclease VII large subunit [Methylomirabilota bacterium]|nr:exodeoxyribonuclease VII large subunit [Methylomirabilota bacterium]